MPTNLHRCYGAGYLHFITTSCYQRRPLLGKAQNRDLFVEALEQVRRRYRFVEMGYVVMPEHIHLLLSEPERGDPSVVMKVLKQSFARRLLGRMRACADWRQGSLWHTALAEGHIWQHRFYDFVVFTDPLVENRDEWGSLGRWRFYGNKPKCRPAASINKNSYSIVEERRFQRRVKPPTSIRASAPAAARYD